MRSGLSRICWYGLGLLMMVLSVEGNLLAGGSTSDPGNRRRFHLRRSRGPDGRRPDPEIAPAFQVVNPFTKEAACVQVFHESVGMGWES